MLQTNDDRWPLWEQGFGGNDESGENASKKEKPEPKKEQLHEKVNDNPRLIEHSDYSRMNTFAKKQDTSRNVNPGQFMKYTSIGTELLAAVLVGTFLGWVVNRLFGNRIPWVIAIGVVIGAIAGLLNIYRLIVEEEQKEKLLKEEKKQAMKQGERDDNASS